MHRSSQNDSLRPATGVPCKRVRSAETRDGIMAEPGTERTSRHAFDKVRGRAQVIRGWAEQTLLWRIWDRMLETEFIDRSIALAGKAFISFFPLIIVIAAFVPARLRTSILTTVTRRLGITGASLATVQQAFSSAEDIRRATG